MGCFAARFSSLLLEIDLVHDELLICLEFQRLVSLAHSGAGVLF